MLPDTEWPPKHKYVGGTYETYGNINSGNSLATIKKLVYDEKIIKLDKLIEILVSNFIGYEKEREMMLDVPKYGNDNEYVDDIQIMFHNMICNVTMSQRNRTNLHSFLVVIINNSVNTIMGRNTGASVYGRASGCYMANANNPFNGTDVNGVTAMLNSIVKLTPDIHAGAVQNIKFHKDIYNKSRDKVRLLLETYFDKGGAQAMICVVDNEDLKKAYENPEGFEDIFVRVGGFSARFVALDKDIQLEILNRTQY